MSRDPDMYNEEIVRDFYASYAANLRGYESKKAKLTAHAPKIHYGSRILCEPLLHHHQLILLRPQPRQYLVHQYNLL